MKEISGKYKQKKLPGKFLFQNINTLNKYDFSPEELETYHSMLFGSKYMGHYRRPAKSIFDYAINAEQRIFLKEMADKVQLRNATDLYFGAFYGGYKYGLQNSRTIDKLSYLSKKFNLEDFVNAIDSGNTYRIIQKGLGSEYIDNLMECAEVFEIDLASSEFSICCYPGIIGIKLFDNMSDEEVTRVGLIYDDLFSRSKSTKKQSVDVNKIINKLQFKQ